MCAVLLPPGDNPIAVNNNNNYKSFISLYLNEAECFVLEAPYASKKVFISLNTQFHALYALSADVICLMLKFYKFLEPN
jgi:hypothetical protein